MNEALCDSFDTPRAVNDLGKLISDANAYLQLPAGDIKLPLVRTVSRYVFTMLKTFGVYGEDDLPSVLGDGEE